MLSYRHGYHAGNYADVLKHAVLAFCIDYMKAKPKPFFVVDSHAGAGVYDLTSEMARKTGEWQEGVARLWGTSPPELFQPWMAVLKSLNPEGDLLDYPGSPEIIRQSLRDQDRALFCELHTTDHAMLDADSRIEIRKADGFKAMTRALPPRERRALVLVDPSYEIKDDYDKAADALVGAHRRFAGGTYILWYPVVDRDRSEHMLARLESSGVRNQLRIEIAVEPDNDSHGMTASGLIIINPPWTLCETARASMPWLEARLGAEGGGFADWLVPE